MRRRSSSSVVGSVQRGRPLNLGVPVSSRKASIASWTGASNGSDSEDMSEQAPCSSADSGTDGTGLSASIECVV